MNGPEASTPGAGERREASPAMHHVELVGPHLRVRGRLPLGRFAQLADLINHNRGFIVLHDAEIVDGTGSAARTVLPELVVNQDEITFIGHGTETTQAPAQPSPGLARRFVIFTPGHTVRGAIHVYRELTLANFVEATDPRFLSMTDATARSLLDPDEVIRYDCLLVNRTQINAIAETDIELAGGGPGDSEVAPA